MGRLPWLIVLGAGPLAASLLVAHGRRSFVAAMDTGSHVGGPSERPYALAREAADCELCSPGDRAVADLELAKSLETRGALDDAKLRLLAAGQEFDRQRLAGPARKIIADELNRVVTELDRRDAERREEDERLAEQARRAAAKPVTAQASVTSLVERGEAALETGDARSALAAIADIDGRDESADPALRDRALKIGGRATALQNATTQSDDYFAQAVTLEIEHRGQEWTDPVATLRLWSDTVGSRPCLALNYSLQYAQHVLSVFQGGNLAQQAARLHMVLGETLAAHGQDVEAARAFLPMINDLLAEQVPDAKRITRDLAKLGMIEAKQGQAERAANHLRTAAQRLDAELSPVRERSETWRHLAEVDLGHANDPATVADAVDADERALAAVTPELDPDDSEVVRDRIELGIALMRSGDRKGAQAQVTAVEHDTNHELSGELEEQEEMLRDAISTGRIPAMLRAHPPQPLPTVKTRPAAPPTPRRLR